MQQITRLEYRIVAWKGSASFVVEEGFETLGDAKEAIKDYKSLPAWEGCSFYVEKY